MYTNFSAFLPRPPTPLHLSTPFPFRPPQRGQSHLRLPSNSVAVFRGLEVKLEKRTAKGEREQICASKLKNYEVGLGRAGLGWHQIKNRRILAHNFVHNTKSITILIKYAKLPETVSPVSGADGTEWRMELNQAKCPPGR